MNHDDYIASAYLTDWKEEEEQIYQNFRQRILAQMEVSDISRLAFIASKEGNTAMQENLEREIRGRRFRDSNGTVDISEIKESVDLLDLLESLVGHVRWKRGGLIRCPLPNHTDGTPSFSINREKGFFICFGCGKKGSVIDLVMEINKCSLPEALQTLKSYL